MLASTKNNKLYLDVVVVPDFLGSRALLFEARTLFFLASWMEVSGGEKLSGHPHICCIGTPPKSVERMAQAAGATISVHEPLPLLHTGFANKLRGLEAPGTADRLLLLDVDVILLNNLSNLSKVDSDFSACPAGKPHLSEEEWAKVYQMLEVPLPTERIASLHGQYNLNLQSVKHQFKNLKEEAQSMLPYFNSGVVLIKRGSDLRTIWENHLCKLQDYFFQQTPPPPQPVTDNDQIPLATALQVLQLQGKTFQQLPAAMNARMPHFKAGALRFDEVRLMHITRFAGELQQRSELGMLVKQYQNFWCEFIQQGFQNRPVIRFFEKRKVHSYLQKLWVKRVKAFWE